MSKTKTEETMDGLKKAPAQVTIRAEGIHPDHLKAIQAAFPGVSLDDCGIALDASGKPVTDANKSTVVMLAVAVPTNTENDGA
jgi:hypothetical protein